MPLSEHERKLLAQMEEALSADDPGLVSTLTGTRLYPGRKRTLSGVGFLLLGIIVIFTGLVVKETLVGILGFIIALGGVTLVISALSRASGFHAPKKKGGKGKLNSRLEDRPQVACISSLGFRVR